MTISENTKISLSLGSAIAGIMGVLTIIGAIIGWFTGFIDFGQSSSAQVVNCDSVKSCFDEKYITKEKLQDSISLFEKDIEYLKAGERDQKEMNREVKESLREITNLLIQIKRDSN